MLYPLSYGRIRWGYHRFPPRSPQGGHGRRQRGSTTNVGTVEPPPAVTFSSGSVARRVDGGRAGGGGGDGLALPRREQGGVALVGQGGEAGLLVQQLAAEGVGQAHRAVAHRPHHRMAQAAALQQLADEDALVDEGD